MTFYTRMSIVRKILSLFLSLSVSRGQFDFRSYIYAILNATLSKMSNENAFPNQNLKSVYILQITFAPSKKTRCENCGRGNSASKTSISLLKFIELVAKKFVLQDAILPFLPRQRVANKLLSQCS
jgi:hypothetical protein